MVEMGAVQIDRTATSAAKEKMPVSNPLNDHCLTPYVDYIASRRPPSDGAIVVQRAPQDFVVGYVFRADFGAVALIEKLKPSWQAGKLNGVGGKIEHEDLDAAHAMTREFAEEAGLIVHPDCWQHIRTEKFMHTTPSKSDQHIGTTVYHFAVRVFDSEWRQIRTMEQERIVKAMLPLADDGMHAWDEQVPTRLSKPYPLIYNMSYLIYMARTLLQQPPENRPVP